MVKIPIIKTFITLVEQKSFIKTANRLSISPPTVTRQINDLEDQLNVTLVNRASHNFQLTSLGEAYYNEAKKFLLHAEYFDKFGDSFQSEVCGNLKIAVPQFFLESCIIPNLSDFYKFYPKLSLSFDVRDGFPNLSADEIDLVVAQSDVVFNEDQNPNIIRKKLMKVRFVICASPKYLEKYKVKSINDLIKMNIIGHSSRGDKTYFILTKENNVELESNLIINDSNALVNAAKHGLGIIQIHDLFVKNELAHGTLVELFTSDVPSFQFSIYYLRNRYSDKKISAFNNFFTPLLNSKLE